MRKFLSAALILFSVILLASCTSDNKASKNDREMTNIEVCTKVGVSPEGLKLPEVPEISWKFYEGEEAKGKTTGKLSMKVHYKETRKYVGDIQLLDLNNLPVTTEAVSLNGAENEDEILPIDLHVSKDVAKRITKAKLVVTPVFK